MLNNCTLHHIAYCIDDVNEALRQWEAWGYTADAPLYDAGLDVTLIYLHKEGQPCVELVHKTDPSQLENRILAAVGTMGYHTCYQTPTFDATCEELASLGYEKCFEPVAVSVFGGKRIVYYHHRTVGYIELLEA